MPVATQTMTIDRHGRQAHLKVQGDLVVANTAVLYDQLRALARRRDVQTIVLDFSQVGRFDSSALAVISLVGRQLSRRGKTFDLVEMRDQHKAVMELAAEPGVAIAAEDLPGWLEGVGDHVLVALDSTIALGRLVGETARQFGLVVAGKKRLPAGAVSTQISTMGIDGLPIVALITFLLGMTIAFQGVIQLQRFGAGTLVADMVGLSIVRELAPLMTAIIIAGRTGAAIAAELGTMQARSEIDALATMGINPARFLILPRMLAITFVGPALSLIGMFVGCVGGMVVAAMMIGMPAVTFWHHLVQVIHTGDIVQGLVKSLLFAWLIGLAGCHLGMRAKSDAGSVGLATTRTVVTSIFFIVIVDAIFATVATILSNR